MTTDFSTCTHRDATEKKLGFKIEESYASPVGLVVEERFDGIDDLIKLSAFTLFLERRHLDAGMPECCVEGKNIRRLAILLHRNRNVKHIVVLKNGNSKHLEFTIKNIRDLIAGDITDEKLEYLWTRGRFARYKFSKEEFKYVFENVTDNLEEITYSTDNISKKRDKLIGKMKKSILEMEGIIAPPGNVRSFFASPSSLDDYIVTETDSAQSISPDDILCARDVSTLSMLCERILFKYGSEVKDYCDIWRHQIEQEIVLKLDICGVQNNLGWKEALENFIIEIENFLGKIGIKDSENAYMTSEFYHRLFESEIRKIRHRNFVERVSDDIINNRLGDSNALTLLIGEDDLLSKKKSKIGWSEIRCYMKPRRENIILSLSHDLRSIDLYDGFPVNMFFCLKYSLKFTGDLMERLPYEIRPKVKLDHLKFIILYLHAYLDDMPTTLMKRPQ